MKEEFNKDMENLRKKIQTETLEIKIAWIKYQIQGKDTPAEYKWKTESQDLKTKIDIKEKMNS
jgi:hypothetical protein